MAAYLLDEDYLMPDDDSEVLFMTSRERIYDAYVKWYRQQGEDADYARAEALKASRHLVRLLDIPSPNDALWGSIGDA